MRSLGSLLGQQRGSVTVEAALALSSLVIVGAGLVGGIATLAAQISAVDQAGAAARAEAIGVAFEPGRGQVEVHRDNGLVHVTATVPAVFGRMRATAVFPVETP